MSFFSGEDQSFLINLAEAQILSDYQDVVSVAEKIKPLLKFGRRVTVGTDWETLMTKVGSELEETFPSGNNINRIVSDDPSDTATLSLEYHTVSGGNLSFSVQEVTLQGTTPVPLDTAAYRVSRMYDPDYNFRAVGNIYVYEDNSGRDDDKTHLVIESGEVQTQKAATSISATDYWIITNVTLSVLSKTSAYAEGRLEVKPIGATEWRPITQNFSAKDSSGTIPLRKDPYIIVPKNFDVRLAVKTNTAGIIVAGGFSGHLAKVIG